MKGPPFREIGEGRGGGGRMDQQTCLDVRGGDRGQGAGQKQRLVQLVQ